MQLLGNTLGDGNCGSGRCVVPVDGHLSKDKVIN